MATSIFHPSAVHHRFLKEEAAPRDVFALLMS